MAPAFHCSIRKKSLIAFFRGDSKEPGSGLGLSIVKEIVLQHNLKISLDSPYLLDDENYHSGTKITLFIPN